MSAVHYDSYTEARSHLKALLDAAERGRVATVKNWGLVQLISLSDDDQLREWLVGEAR